MKLPSYNVEVLPLERRLYERSHPAKGLRSPRPERRRAERRIIESGDNITPIIRD